MKKENVPQSFHQQFDVGLPGGDNNRRSEGDSNWQHIARTHRIESNAQMLGIPERSWNHPTVHSFVEATIDARDIQTFMSIRQMRLDFEMEPSLSERYSDGELLMRGVCMILTDGLNGKASYVSEYLAGKVGIVTRRFGVMVTELPTSETQIPEVQVPSAMPGSAWADFRRDRRGRISDDYARQYGWNKYELWGNDAPRQHSTRADELRLRDTAQRLGIPGQSTTHPIVQEFLINLHDMEDLLTTVEQGELPPGAPGLTPSVADRYHMSSHLLHVGEALLEEGFQGRTVDPQFVANHVTSALTYYGLQARLQLS